VLWKRFSECAERNARPLWGPPQLKAALTRLLRIVCLEILFRCKKYVHQLDKNTRARTQRLLRQNATLATIRGSRRRSKFPAKPLRRHNAEVDHVCNSFGSSQDSACRLSLNLCLCMTPPLTSKLDVYEIVNSRAPGKQNRGTRYDRIPNTTGFLLFISRWTGSVRRSDK